MIRAILPLISLFLVGSIVSSTNIAVNPLAGFVQAALEVGQKAAESDCKSTHAVQVVTYTTGLYADVIDCFAGKKSLYKASEFLPHIKLIELTTDKGVKRFFGVHKDHQKNVDFNVFKRAVVQKMSVDQNNMIQIIGDSAAFSEEGTKYCKEHLEKIFCGTHLLEYGFTGYHTDTEYDINSFLTAYLKANPTQAHRVLGNVVGHTHDALHPWKCKASDIVGHFVVVYNDDGMAIKPHYDVNGVKLGGYTTFGDDTTMSDFVMQASQGDKLICIEGGAQSFLQVINALSINVPVELVYNVRKSEREKFFSAARALLCVAECLSEDANCTPDKARKAFDAYVQKLENMWDLKKGDHKTKQALFEKAKDEFFGQKYYLRVKDLCKFTDAKSK